MDYSQTIESLNARPNLLAGEVADVEELNRTVASELATELRTAIGLGRKLVVIAPVGPLDYRYWAELLNQQQLDGSALVIINMDEYLDSRDQLVSLDHPLSFRRFMQETLFDRLEGRSRIPQANRIFPDPAKPDEIPGLLSRHGAADICYAGIGLSGHLAFNDPPGEDEPCDDDAVRHSATRAQDLLPATRAQVCLCGTDGVWDIVPHRAATIGMREILSSRYVHVTLLRSWHAGLWRRAFFGPVTGRFPASFLQQHPNVRVTATRLAASVPALHTALRV